MQFNVCFLGRRQGQSGHHTFLLAMGACPDGYLEGRLIYFKRRADPASKQKVKVALKFVIIFGWFQRSIPIGRKDLSTPLDQRVMGKGAEKGVAAA